MSHDYREVKALIPDEGEPMHEVAIFVEPDHPFANPALIKREVFDQPVVVLAEEQDADDF